MLKKLLLSTLLAACAMNVSAEIKFSYSYDHSKHTAKITKWSGTPSSTVNVPMQVSYDGSSTMYTVTAIEAGAMNGISGMKKLAIPNTVVQIGYVYSRVTAASEGADLSNFIDCPDLEKIEVASGNPYFKATGAGILTSADGTQVYRIPPKIDMSGNNGVLKMATTGIAIAKNAFQGNTSLKKVTFSKNLNYIAREPGLDTATSITAFDIPAGGDAEKLFMVYGGALIEKSSKTLLHYPIAAPAASYTVYSTYVEKIASKAFANTITLKEINISEGVKTFQNYAFLNSSVSVVNLPSTLNFLTNNGRGAFMNSQVTKVNWNNGERTSIPKDFMLGCTKLKSFICANSISDIGGSAFRNCSSLETFSPFDGNTAFDGDSIWAYSGLKEVIYEKTERTSNYVWNLKATFLGCKNLKKLDMSQYYVPSDRNQLELGKDFAAECPSLETIALPGYIAFEKDCFKGSENIKRIILSEFEIKDAPAINYSSNTAISPECFVMIPEGGAGYFSTPIQNLFGTSGQGALNPVFYFETVYPLLSSLVPGSKTYIPGGTTSRYPTPTEGTELIELYSFSLKDMEHYIDVTLKPLSFVKINRIVIDGDEVDIPESGIISLKPELRKMKFFNIYYEVNGVEMFTQYPANLLPWDRTTGVTEEQLSAEFGLNGRMLTIPETATAEIYDINGILRARINGGESDLAGLQNGIYICLIKHNLQKSSVKLNLK